MIIYFRLIENPDTTFTNICSDGTLAILLLPISFMSTVRIYSATQILNSFVEVQDCIPIRGRGMYEALEGFVLRRTWC